MKNGMKLAAIALALAPLTANAQSNSSDSKSNSNTGNNGGSQGAVVSIRGDYFCAQQAVMREQANLMGNRTLDIDSLRITDKPEAYTVSAAAVNETGVVTRLSVIVPSSDETRFVADNMEPIDFSGTASAILIKGKIFSDKTDGGGIETLDAAKRSVQALSKTYATCMQMGHK